MQEPIAKYNTIKERVEYILTVYKETRNDYARFLNAYTRIFHPSWGGDFTKIPSIESLNRARRKVSLSDLKEEKAKTIKEQEQPSDWWSNA